VQFGSYIGRLCFFCLTAVICIAITSKLHAQAPQDTVDVEIVSDTVVDHSNDSTFINSRGKVINIKTYSKRFQPRKALLYSAIVPGLGQAYNKKYWKLPIIYGGFIMLGTVVVVYNNFYVKYRNELISVVADPTYPTTYGYTEEQLRTVVDTYRRQRDYFIVLSGFLYVLQFIDAHVDAHLKEFDLNPQLKLSLEPSVQQNALIGSISGVSLVLKF
jgi:Family of unknown function (DUF5683)